MDDDKIQNSYTVHAYSQTRGSLIALCTARHGGHSLHCVLPVQPSA